MERTVSCQNYIFSKRMESEYAPKTSPTIRQDSKDVSQISSTVLRGLEDVSKTLAIVHRDSEDGPKTSSSVLRDSAKDVSKASSRRHLPYVGFRRRVKHVFQYSSGFKRRAEEVVQRAYGYRRRAATSTCVGICNLIPSSLIPCLSERGSARETTRGWGGE